MWRWALLFFSVSLTVFAIQSGDVLMYLSLARDFILSGEWKQIDPYVYANMDHILVWWHEYLSYLVFYGTWLASGFAGVILLKSLILGLMFYMTLSQQKKFNLLWIGLFILAILAGSFRYIERSSLFSDLFTLGLGIILLNRNRPSRKLALTFGILFFVWIQLHPGFVAGAILLTIWTIAHAVQDPPKIRNQRIALWFIALIPLLLNPLGLDGVLYPIRFALNEANTLRLYNFEWFPAYHPAFRYTPETISFWILSLSCFSLLIASRKIFSLRSAFVVLSFLMASQTVRFIPWASLLMVSAVTVYIRPMKPFFERRSVQISIAILLIAIGTKNMMFGYQSSSGERLPQLELDPKFFPSKTLEVLREHRQPGNLYNSHDLGGSLIWNHLGPVFHHGFVTDMSFFKDEVIGALTTEERFFELAKKYNWTMLLVDKYGGYREIHRILSPHPEWRIVAEDDAAYLIYKFYIPN